MNNLIRLYERNNYYTGKLLSEKDFKTEQSYFNDKRSLLNVFTMGSGILYGLDVVPTGTTKQEEDTISIKPGLAIDSCGREIVVPEIETRVLNKIDDFPEDEYIGSLYLCLESVEKHIDESSAITDDRDESEEIRYNRTLEGYRLVWKKGPPDGFTGIERFFYNVVTLYEDERVILQHKSPKYMNEGEAFECSFILIKLHRNVRVKLDYDVTADGLNVLKKLAPIENGDRSKETEKEYKYTMDGSNKDGCLYFDSKNLKLIIGDESVSIKPAKAIIQYETLPVMEKAVRDYYRENLEERKILSDKDQIFLKKVFIIQVKVGYATNYYVEHIEDTLFARYIYPQYLQSFIFDRKKAVKASKAVETQIEEEIPDEPIEMVKTGIIRIPLKEAFKKVYYTDEISHGLGKGQVYISVGVEERDNSLAARTGGIDEVVFSGDMDVFKKSDFTPDCGDVAIGTVLYPRKGTFKIGVSVREADLGKEWVMLRWWASRCEVADLLEL